MLQYIYNLPYRLDSYYCNIGSGSVVRSLSPYGISEPQWSDTLVSFLKLSIRQRSNVKDIKCKLMFFKK